MKFSLNWLREFVDLPDRLEELTDLLTLAGVEIEGVEGRGADIRNVIVGQIRASSRHPNADRLSVCEVDDGSGISRQVVCGATNYQVGDKVPLALPGAVLPNGSTIRASKLRGVESEGMLCSAIELGLGQDAAGLLILSPAAGVGMPLRDVFPNDTVLDVEITPNRGDLLSHFGLAREIAALTSKTLGRPFDHAAGAAPQIEPEGIELRAAGGCPFFSARLIEDVRVGPSPDWLRAKIESVGIRSINNIVDISNFVMLELGQPTHAFDADKVKSKISVRFAAEGEICLALDGKTYNLNCNDVIVADDAHAVGIGGVMGGEESGVTAATRNVLLEAAYFDPATVRRTARALNLPSDASYRFERGVDPGMILRASQRAAELMRDLASGHPSSKLWAAGKVPEDPAPVELRYARCDRLLGITVPPRQVDEILGRFRLVRDEPASTGESSRWRIPSHRRDLRREVDLVEEVVRLYGVNKIRGSDRSRFTQSSLADREYDEETRLRWSLVARGLTEVRTSKLVPRTSFGLEEERVHLRNALSEEHVALRPNLIGGLLAVLARNARAGAERVAAFESGRVFLPPHGREERHIGLLLWGRWASEPNWRAPQRRLLDFFDLKGAVDVVLGGESVWQKSARPGMALAAEIRLGDNIAGFAGQLAGAVASQLDAAGPVFVAEIFGAALNNRPRTRSFVEFGRFPAVTRDLAMIVSDGVTHEQIHAAIVQEPEPLLESVKLFDLFTGKDAQHLGSDRKSLAYTLTYRDKSRTLTSDEVTAAHNRIRERLKSELGAELRE